MSVAEQQSQLWVSDCALTAYIIADSIRLLKPRMLIVTPAMKCLEKASKDKSVYISMVTPGMKLLCLRDKNYDPGLIHWFSTIPRCITEYDKGIGFYAEVDAGVIEELRKKKPTRVSKKVARGLERLGKNYPVLKRFLEMLASSPPQLCDNGEVAVIDYERIPQVELIYPCPSIGFLYYFRRGNNVVRVFYAGFR